MCLNQRHINGDTRLQKNQHTELVNRILVEISHRKNCRVWKSHVGMAEMPNGRQVKYGIPGMPDIMGILKVTRSRYIDTPITYGQAIGIEVKTGQGRLSDHQKKFHDMFMSHGGNIFVARDLNSVLIWLDDLDGA